MHPIAIVGAGVIGLSIGWQLARENLSVHLFEQRTAGRQASYAAAGMLAPYSEATHPSLDLLAMGKQSLTMYPRFLKELAEDSPVAVPQESDGTLYVAINRDDREWLQRQYLFKKKSGMPIEWLSGEEARQKESLLSPRVNAAIWTPLERQIDTSRLITALKDAFLKCGGILTENTPIAAWQKYHGQTLALYDNKGQSYLADHLILTTGAWPRPSTQEEEKPSPSIHPIKGQLLHLKMAPHLHLTHMLRTPRIYFAPKQSGSVRVGATSEDLGLNEEVTAGAVLELLENAREALPAVSEYLLEGVLVGLRPMTANQRPSIGATAIHNVYQAIGHGRSGILLAPYTAYSIKRFFL